MTLFEKALKEIAEADLQELVALAVPEGKSIEYKLALPKADPADKKEFLADVTSIANASGGLLLFGIREDKGIAVEITGLTVSDADQEMLRLSNMLQSGVEPRIPALEMRSVQLANGNSVIAIRTPRSWLGPHMIKESGRFFARSSNGKHPLDVAEIRNSFLETERLTSRLKEFRAERLSAILADEIPVSLGKASRIVLHAIPLSGLTERSEIDLHRIARNEKPVLYPMDPWSNCGTYFVFEGVVCCQRNQDGTSPSYTLVARNGACEIVADNLCWTDEKGFMALMPSYEKRLVDYWPVVRRTLETANIEPPIMLALSLLNIRNHMFTFNAGQFHMSLHPIRQQHLVLPECMLESWNDDIGDCLRPAFNMVANAQGIESSPHFGRVARQ